MLLKGDDEMSLAERITEDVKIAMKNGMPVHFKL